MIVFFVFLGTVLSSFIIGIFIGLNLGATEKALSHNENIQKKRKHKYEPVLKCTECGHILDDDEQMYSSGICPYCGYSSHSTVCNTVTEARPVWGQE